MVSGSITPDTRRGANTVRRRDQGEEELRGAVNSIYTATDRAKVCWSVVMDGAAAHSGLIAVAV